MQEAQAAVGQAPPLVHSVVRTLRPKQWAKNVLVIAAAGAAGALGSDDVPVRVALACVAFCLLASGLYAINDVRDAAEDRLHPRKRYRPVAAGELDPQLATTMGIVLIAAGLFLCDAIRPLLALVAVGYVLLTLSYTLIWRHLLLFDIVAIAGGFVLRAVAGGVAAPVALSRWFLVVITCAAVSVAAGKRLGELMRSESIVAGTRRVLGLYTERRLRLIVILSTWTALLAYCIWAFELPTVNGVPWRPLTIVPVTLALTRYAIVAGGGGGEAPEDVILHDRTLLAAAAVWLALFALGVHAAG